MIGWQQTIQSIINVFCIGKTKELPLGQGAESGQEMDKEVRSQDCRQGY